jgi:MFS family permease
MMGSEEEREYGPSGSVHEWRAGWRRISWGAIFAGAFVTMAIFITLQLLGAGIGALSLDLTGSRTTSSTSLGIGAAIWWLITGLIALFIGGWVAGRLGWRPAKVDRALHGLTTWAVFYVALFLMVSTALGALLGGGLSLLGSSVSAAGQVASTPQGQQAMQQTMQSQGVNAQSIQQQIDKIMGAGASQQNQQANAQVTAAVNNYLSSTRTPQDRQRAVQTITQATGMSEDQANQMLSNLEQSGQPVSGQQVAGERAKEQAKETGERTANITGGTLVGISIAMILGAIVAVLGSLAAAMPPYVPPYEREREREREAAAARERTYAGTR